MNNQDFSIASAMREIAEVTGMECWCKNTAPTEDPASVEDIIEQTLKIRRRRSEHLPSELFGEPAWDVVLDLYLAKKRGKKISVSSACIASSVPATTALRWINILSERGIVIRRQDNKDGRRNFLELSDQGVAAVERIFGFQAGQRFQS